MSVRQRLAQRQQGVALITVLLVLFLASITATKLATLQQASIRRSELFEQQRQARWYTLSAEQWAQQLLERDRDDSDIDHLNEPWAQLPPALSVSGGSLNGRLEDLQGRLNVNNLVHDEAPQAELALARLTRLLTLLELPPELAEAIADWIDADQDRRLQGAEDGDYLGGQISYLSAGQPLLSLSELRLIKGIDDDIYRRLLPYLSALPTGAAVNVNTAPAEVLAALYEDQNVVQMQALADQRRQSEFASIGDFLRAVGRQQPLAPDNPSGDNLSVASDYFLLRAEARVGIARAQVSSLFARDESGARVLLRHFGGAL